MFNNSEIFRREVVKLVPASLINDLACYVLYDNYPRDHKYTDITVVTNTFEVIEFYQRNKLSSVLLKCEKVPEEIVLFRNSIGKLFYLVSAGETLFVLQRDEVLKLYKTVNDVIKYEITDDKCSGCVVIKIMLQSDAVPLIYDDNFGCLREIDNLNQSTIEDSSPIAIQLQRKLREANYSLKSNEKALNNLMSLRQSVAFSRYQMQCPNLKDTIFASSEKIATELKIITQMLWVKSCNEKLVIIFHLLYQNNVPLEEVNILFSNSSQCLIYTSKIYEKLNKPPFWTESTCQIINPDTETAIVCVINIGELKSNVLSRIDFKGIICYKQEGKDYLLPFNDVHISSLDTMGEHFDVLATENYDDNNMLAILATTEKLDMVLKHNKYSESSKVLELPDIFCRYLNMDIIFGNIVIHKKSPYHILNGLMVVFHDAQDLGHSATCSVSVYGRTISQILALLHHIYDSIPFRIVITLHTQGSDAEDKPRREVFDPNKKGINSSHHGSKKINLILEFLASNMSEVTEIKTKTISDMVME